MKFQHQASADVPAKLSGWSKPQRKPTLVELEEKISDLRAELQQLETQAADIRDDARLAALAAARNIVRAHQLTAEDLA